MKNILKKTGKIIGISLGVLIILIINGLVTGEKATNNFITIDFLNEEKPIGEKPIDEKPLIKEITINGEALPEGAKFVLRSYFERVYSGFETLVGIELNNLFLDPKSENAQINQNEYDYLLNLRLAQENDLRLEEYEIDLSVNEISFDEEGKFYLKINETNRLNFMFLKEVDAESTGILHEFVLVPFEDSYKIESHKKDEDSFLLQDEAMKKSLPTETVINESRKSVKTISELKKTQTDEKEKELRKKAQNPYNREAAVTYAKTWVDNDAVIRNEIWGIYDAYGGNCNNYISQAIYAGGIPMDYDGSIEMQWKWFDEEYNGYEENIGYTPSWIVVPRFWEYVENNTGFGLVGETELNLFLGEIGDIIQYGALDEWRHSVIITDVIKDDQGKVIDYLICSNTTDRMNYPASAYGYGDMRLIKIIGWNEMKV